MPISKGMCILSLKSAAEKYLDSSEVNAFITDFENKVEEIKANETLRQDFEVEAEVAKQMADERKLNALILKRQAAKNAIVRLKVWNFVQQYPAKDWNKALKHYLGGTAGKYRYGNASSVARQMDSVAAQRCAKVVQELDDNNLTKFFKDKTNHKAIAIELGELRDGGQPGKSGSELAKQAAEILARHQDEARLWANQNGANIEKLPGYIIAQSHDSEKLHPKKGETIDQAFERWWQFVSPRLDYARTFRGMKAKKVAREIWEALESGVHLDYSGDGIGIRTGGNKAQQLSNSRKLHFKDGEAFYEYMEMYGKHGLVDGYINGIKRLTKATILMQKLGTNPVDTISKVYEAMRVTTAYSKDTDVRKSLTRGVSVDTQWDKGVEDLFKEVTGRTNIPVSEVAAKLNSNIRTTLSSARLGMSTISSFSDIATLMNNAAYMGLSRSDAFMQAIRMLTTFSKKKQLSAAERHFLADFGIIADTIRSNLYNHIASSNYMGSGFFTKMSSVFFHLNGQTAWTQAIKSASALSINHGMGEWLSGSFGEILPRMQKRLEAYRIGQKEFELLKKMPFVEDNGRKFMSPELVHKIPDEDFAKYLGIDEKTAGYKDRIYQAKKQLESDLITFVYDMSNTSAIEPDAIVRAWMNRGTQVGSFEGEVLRSLGQFKSFPISIITRIVNPWVANASGIERVVGLADFALATTALGYLSVTCKDVLRGKTPQEFGPEAMQRALLQGGALGLFGDILFGEAQGSVSLAGILGGPTLSAADDLYNIYIKAREGDDAAAEFLKRARNFVPGQNLFWAKLPIDYLFMYRFQEWANPGYLDRLERNLYNKTGQEFWLDPGTFVK